jgi:hypothetical protein
MNLDTIQSLYDAATDKWTGPNWLSPEEQQEAGGEWCERVEYSAIRAENYADDAMEHLRRGALMSAELCAQEACAQEGQWDNDGACPTWGAWRDAIVQYADECAQLPVAQPMRGD